MRPFDYSFEFFPPKTKAANRRLETALDELEFLNPEFVSITYGAGGSTQERTFKAVESILKERTIAPAAHLTCVGASRKEIDEIVQGYLDIGVSHIVALRGDPQEGIGQSYKPRQDGYAYASDLVAGIRKLSSEVEISVSAYPERHPESPDWADEIDNLKRKVDAGANRAITQFFFKADTFLDYQDKVSRAGIDIPIIPGIMLQPNFEGLCRMAHLCGVKVPGTIASSYQKAGRGEAARHELTVELAAKLVDDLRAGGVEHFHFYTLNTAPIAIEVIKNIRQRGRLKRAA